MACGSRWLIATDLDGTLLDDSYPYAEAAQVLDELQISGLRPWIALASSKTLAEMSAMARMARQPVFLIFENGGGVAWPQHLLARRGAHRIHDYEVLSFAGEYEGICRVLRALRQQGFIFQGFADMSSADVAEATGLSRSQAEQARARMTSEPIKWLGSEEQLAEFARALARHGLSMVRGGRFHHISRGGSKALAIDFLAQQLRQQYTVPVQVLACGDAPNDLEMIDQADRAVVFPDKSGAFVAPRSVTVEHAVAAGPLPWLDAVRAQLTKNMQAQSTQEQTP